MSCWLQGVISTCLCGGIYYMFLELTTYIICSRNSESLGTNTASLCFSACPSSQTPCSQTAGRRRTHQKYAGRSSCISRMVDMHIMKCWCGHKQQACSMPAGHAKWACWLVWITPSAWDHAGANEGNKRTIPPAGRNIN